MVSDDVSFAVADSPRVAREVLEGVLEMTSGALSDCGEWLGSITPDSRFDGDLGMQSVELAGLRARLVGRWGPAADPDPLLRTLDLAGLTDLTVRDLAAYVTTRLGTP